jgi:hypothetical protein
MEIDELLNDLVWVYLKEPDDFLKVRETLSRIGIASFKEHTLTQTAHILHKQGHYAIVHFKQLFLLDRKPSDFTQEDRARLNTIANLLQEWGLVELVDPEKSAAPVAPLSMINIVRYKEKSQWTFVTKYSIGKKRY